MDIENKTETEQPLYGKNTFLVIQDLSAKHDFSLCLLEKDLKSQDKQMKVIALKRDDKKGINYFKPDRQEKTDVQKILFSTDEVQIIQYVGEEQSQSEFEQVKIYLKKQIYEKIRKQVKEVLTERGVLNSEEEIESEDENQIITSEEIEIVSKNDRKKVLGRKKAKISKQKASSQGSQSLGKKIKGGRNDGSKISKAKNKDLVYRKGKFNPNVSRIETSQQYESQSNDPDFSCCQICNNKEMLRAVLTKNYLLFNTILNTNKKVSSFASSCGPNSATTVVSVLLQDKNYKDFFRLSQAERKESYFSSSRLKFGFSAIDTGYNDKYAYGVATRKVEMGRGNREGTNAFLYDSYIAESIYRNEVDMESIYRYFSDEDSFLHMVTYEQDLINFLEGKVADIVLIGNRFLAMKLAERMYLSGGWGFNKFHFLALSAQTEAELEEMKKSNTKKKAYENCEITPIHLACINPNPNILNVFLELGEEIYIVDQMLRKPVHYAATCETIGPLKLLLDKGVDCRDYDKDKMTPLMYAAITGRADNIKLMCTHVQYGVNYKCTNGHAAIHLAVLYNNLEAVAELLNFGANINLPGENRMTPLMIAAERGYYEIVQFLLEKGARILSKDKHKKTALLHSVINGHVKIASYLLEKGAEFLGTDSSGNSAIHFACAYGQWEMLEILVKAGGDINAPNSWNLSPIFVALMKNHYRCVLKLTEFPNINVNCQDNSGSTLLMNNVGMFTAETFKTVEFLIKSKNADVNISDFSGNTALHMLAMRIVKKKRRKRNYFEAIKKYNEKKKLFRMFFDLLVSSGADVNKRNLKSFTPLEIAVDCQNLFFIELILENPDLDWLSYNAENQTIIHNSYLLFNYKKGREIIERMILKVWNNEAFHKMVDENGYNFYHSIFVNFFKDLKYHSFKNVYYEKILFYEDYLDECSPETENNEEERTLLLAKIEKAETKKEKHSEILVSTFENFNEFLRKLKYDFSVNVSIVKEPIVGQKRNDIISETVNKSQKDTNYSDLNSDSNNLDCTKPMNDVETEQEKNWRVVNKKAGCSILHLCMIYPEKRILTQLLTILMENESYKANSQDYNGKTVFYYFAKKNQGNREIAKILLEAGENPNLPTKNNDFPFLIICQKGNHDVFVELLANNVNVNIKNNEGLSPLIYFAKNRQTWYVQELISYGADINIRDGQERNALHWAINNNKCKDTDFNLEDFLINKGIDVNAIDVRGRTPLHYFFCKIGDPFISSVKDPIEIVSDYLINKNLKIDVEDSFGNTPLMYACQRGAYMCVVILRKRGANLNHENKNGNRPIATALLFQKIDVAIYLMQQNVEFNMPCYDIDFSAQLKWEIEQEKKKKEKSKLDVENSMITGASLKDESYFVSAHTNNQNNDSENGVGKEQNNFNSNQNPEKTSTSPSKRTLGDNSLYPHSGLKLSQQKSKVNNFSSAYNEQIQSDLKMLAAKFVRRKLSIFELAIAKKADSITYLLIASGFQIGRTVYDSINANLHNYAIKILNKKVDDDPERNLEAFNYVSEEGRNLFHLLALKSLNFSPEVLNNLYNLFIAKKIPIGLKDHFGMEPIFYAALNKNMILVNKFLLSGASAAVTDNFGNNLVTCFIQNNKTLTSTFKRRDAKLKFSFTKSPLLSNVTNPFDCEFGVGIFEHSGMTLRAEKEKIQKMDIEEIISKQAQINDENVQIAWLKSLIQSANISLDTPFNMLTKKSYNIVNIEFYEESSKPNSLLFYVVRKLQNLKLLELLVEHGIDLNTIDDKGHTVLTYAIRKNNILLISFLLQFEKKINFHLRDNQGKTYIHHIVSPMKNASYENLALLEYFAKRTSLDTPDISGHSPLFYALQQDSGIMARHLELLGATSYLYKISRMPTSVVSAFDFQMSEFDFEEDHLHYVEHLKNKYMNTGIEVEKKLKPDRRLKGEIELFYDKDSNQPYDVKLVRVDIEFGKYSANLFYIMQIAFDKMKKIYVLFTSWGRVGTDGQFQQTPFFHSDDAVKEFKKIFKEKTGNEYDERANFEKCPNKYRLLKTVPAQIHSNSVKFFDLKSPQTIASNLPLKIYYMMQDLTNIKLYKIVYSSLRIDQTRLPFGYLDSQLIDKAQEILEQMRELIKKMENDENKNSLQTQYELATQISEKTSEYLEIIPREGIRTEQIPAFDMTNVNSETKLLNDLRYTEVVSRILAAANYRIREINPLDYCFTALNIKMVPLEVGSEEFSILKMYLKTGITGSPKEIIKNIFAVERKGEVDRFKTWLSIGNRRLLWHGTRPENLMAILYNGLRIAPADGGYNGSNLGRGIYFSDAFQRSLPFSTPSKCRSTYILLAEVALGKMYKSSTPQAISVLAADYNSVKGKGRRVHDKNQRVFLSNGCMVPIGKFIEKPQNPNSQNQNNQNSFVYNEYVVYDPAQVKIRYIMELNW